MWRGGRSRHLVIYDEGIKLQYLLTCKCIGIRVKEALDKKCVNYFYRYEYNKLSVIREVYLHTFLTQTVSDQV